MDSISVRALGSDEVDRALAVQVLAFGSDPVMRWLFPEAGDYLRYFPDFTRAFGGGAFEHGTAHVVGDFGGVALWLPPGVEVNVEAIGAVVAEALDGSALGGGFGFLEEMDAYHIKEPHWYLPVIGVDPAQQGRGLGAALLRHALAQADAAHLPAYLESSNPANISLYQRHGFEALGTIQADGSPVITPMLRRARE